MKCVCAAVLWSVLLSCSLSVAQEVVATIDGEPITDRDVAEFGQRTPMLAAYLSAPGGPMRLLQLMIDDRLFLLEGERQQIPRPGDGSDQLYLMKLQNELVPGCPELTEADARAFYQAHLGQFSTPLFLRLRRIGLPIAGGDEQVVGDRLLEIKASIVSGERDFAEIADALSHDDIGRGRGGDIGYMPIDVSQNPVLSLLVDAAPDEIIGPLVEGDVLFLYQVLARREPIVEPFETVRDQVPKVYARVCREQRLDAVINELKTRWPVEVLVDDIAVHPEMAR